MYGYVMFYGTKKYELYADSIWDAHQKLIAQLSIPKSKQYLVAGMLAEKDGEPVIHTASQ